MSKLTFKIFWSEEDGEWVAICDLYPYLSWLESTPEAALKGLAAVLEGTYTDNVYLSQLGLTPEIVAERELAEQNKKV